MKLSQKFTTLSLAPEYRRAIGVSLVLQIVPTLLLASILDGGRLARVGGATMIGFWIGVIAVIVRRPVHPNKFDLVYIRWGFPVILLTMMGLMDLVGRLRG
jgi:hypothetical protein